MNFDKFNKQLQSGDYARSNLFEVEISAPPILRFAGADIPDTMKFMVKAAALPGKQLGEQQIKRFGAQFKMANEMIVDTLPLTIMCSKDMRERDWFDAWISVIHGAGLGSSNLYRNLYYDMYNTTVRITSLNRKLKEEYSIQLLEAWPNNMGQVELSWDNSEVSTFTLTLAFRDWVSVQTD